MRWIADAMEGGVWMRMTRSRSPMYDPEFEGNWLATIALSSPFFRPLLHGQAISRDRDPWWE